MDKFTITVTPRVRIKRLNGAWARAERTNRGITGREVSRRMGISAAYLCDLELGRRPFNEDIERRFMAAISRSYPKRRVRGRR